MRGVLCVLGAMALSGCIADVETSQPAEADELEAWGEGLERSAQAPPERARPIRDPPPDFSPPPLWYEPSLYRGGGWVTPGPGGSRGGAASSDTRGPGGALVVLCLLGWNSAQWAAFYTRYCERRHGGAGGAGAATPQEAAERVRSCEAWQKFGMAAVSALCAL